MTRRAAHFELGASRRLAVAALVVHGLAALSIAACTAVEPVLRAVLVVPIVASALGSWRVHVTRSAQRAVCALACDEQGWQVRLASGERVPVTPCPASLVHPLLTVLALRERGGRRHAVIVLEEMLDPPSYRRLRALLTERGEEDEARDESTR